MQTVRKIVDLEKVEFASFPKRIAARLIDSFIVGGLLFAFLSLSGIDILDENIKDSTILMVSFYALLFSLAYEIPTLASRGLTIGKRVCGICVVRTDGLIGIGFDRAFVRTIVPNGLTLLPIVGGLLSLGSQIWCFFDPKRQNFPDKAAKTFVIKIPKPYQLLAEPEPDFIEAEVVDGES